MSLHIAKLFKSPLALASAALVIHIGAATAADSTADIQQQMKELLTPAAALTQSPLVMRMGKDEFRIAFGIKGDGCAASGCHGRIRYRVNWRAEDGMDHSEIREVGYTVEPHTARTITVDRQYFDTSEGAHTTEVVEVMVTRVTCHHGIEAQVSRRGPTPSLVAQ